MSSQRIAKERFIRLNENALPGNDSSMNNIQSSIDNIREEIAYIYEGAEDAGISDALEDMDTAALLLDKLEGVLVQYLDM